jgi:N-acetylglucosaminyl-diphospho-decaprenol L-rhamnosyltransferase
VAGAAVVIVNFRTPQLAKRCAAVAQEAAAVGEVVVIDSASGDGSAAELRAAGLQVQEQDRNAGFAAAVNAGFRATSAPIVIVLNADAEPDPGALDRLVEHLHRNPRVAVAVPSLRFPDGEPQPNGYRRFPGLAMMFVELCAPLGYAFAHAPRLDPYRAPAARRCIAHAMGAALAIRRAAYDDAGPFDERFFLYLEETEWQQRVRACGWRIERVAGAGVVHHMRAGAGADAPPVQFVVSARRYLVGEGHSPRTTALVLNSAILCSRLGLRALAALRPAKRDVLRRRASG